MSIAAQLEEVAPGHLEEEVLRDYERLCGSGGYGEILVEFREREEADVRLENLSGLRRPREWTDLGEGRIERYRAYNGWVREARRVLRQGRTVIRIVVSARDVVARQTPRPRSSRRVRSTVGSRDGPARLGDDPEPPSASPTFTGVLRVLFRFAATVLRRADVFLTRTRRRVPLSNFSKRCPLEGALSTLDPGAHTAGGS